MKDVRLRAIIECLTWFKKDYLLYTLQQLAQLSQLYIGYIYIGKIVDQLAASQFQNLSKTILSYFLIVASLKFMDYVVSPLVIQEEEITFRFIFGRVKEKVSRLPLSVADSPALNDQVTLLVQMEYSSPYSFLNVYHRIKSIIVALFHIVWSIVLVYPLLSIHYEGKSSGIQAIFLSQWSLLFIALIFGASIVLQMMNTKKIQSFFMEIGQSVQRTNALYNYEHSMMDQGVVCSKEVKFYNLAEKIEKDRQLYFEQLNKMLKGYAYLNENTKVISEVFSTLALMFTYLIIGARVLVGAFTIGLIVQISGVFIQILKNLGTFLQYIAMFFEKSILTNYYDFLDQPEEVVQGSLPVEKRLDNDYQLAMKDVSFAYNQQQEIILKNISQSFSVGKKYAIVGENGSGKSTFIKVLMRLNDVTKGNITLNDIPIQKYNRQEYYSLFSVVFQDYQLLDFSIGENVAVSQQYDKERVSSILEELGLFDLAQRLDDYVGTEYDNSGKQLSGGQSQKIAMARAIYKNAPIMILDEPTSALDPIAEYEVYQQFSRMAKDKTAFYISHRLSSCRFCDEILVFDKGEIIQRGSHDELVNQVGKYQELWQAQAQYYQ